MYETNNKKMKLNQAKSKQVLDSLASLSSLDKVGLIKSPQFFNYYCDEKSRLMKSGSEDAKSLIKWLVVCQNLTWDVEFTSWIILKVFDSMDQYTLNDIGTVSLSVVGHPDLVFRNKFRKIASEKLMQTDINRYVAVIHV